MLFAFMLVGLHAAGSVQNLTDVLKLLVRIIGAVPSELARRRAWQVPREFATPACSLQPGPIAILAARPLTTNLHATVLRWDPFARPLVRQILPESDGQPATDGSALA